MDPLRADLAAWMGGETDDMSVDDDTPEVADLAGAERVGRRLAQAEAELREIAVLADAERERITSWEEDRSTGPRRVVRWATRALEGFCRQTHSEQTGKVWKLPSVVMRLTAPHMSLFVDDDRRAVEFCESAGMSNVVVPHVARAELRKHVTPGPALDEGQAGDEAALRYAAVTDTGEIVPGVHFERPRHPTFSVKPTTITQPEGE